jgi:hypothetical protein
MPQTIALVSLENSGRSKLTFRTSLLAFVFVLEVLSDTAESSLFYKRKRISLQISLRYKNMTNKQREKMRTTDD